jgi:hypothetical protein
LARAPLVWLGEPDPVKSIETIRDEDIELANIREFFELWQGHLRLDVSYTTARLIEIAESSSIVMHPLKEFFLKVAARRGREAEISPDRTGSWLVHISGRVVSQLRLVKEKGRAGVRAFRLVRI